MINMQRLLQIHQLLISNVKYRLLALLQVPIKKLIKKYQTIKKYLQPNKIKFA